MSCLDSETLEAWVDGALPTMQREHALSHVAECAMCREIASALMRAAPEASLQDTAAAPALQYRSARLREHVEDADATRPMQPVALGTLPPPGYLLGETIGRGGMGAVVAAQDLRIGREVAVKRMTTPTPDGDQLARFLREARVQARLEHPAIVPVHEVGIDELGRPFFTMKRITGHTLSRRLAEGAAPNRLLRVFVDVCRAIEFAHARGVVHRDLKPSNIMIGDYGETYVIDWGIARVLADAESPTPHHDLATLDSGSTRSGTVLGTFGYMSPEQFQGQHATPAADVYSLGAILFELLTGHRLHERGKHGAVPTFGAPQARPSERHPDHAIPPELDTLCFAALAERPDARPSAHDLAEKVQAYLDGDRDLARRRELAAGQLAAAREALAAEDPAARALAMQRAGRAHARVPDSAEAAGLVGSLLLEPPRSDRMPPDLVRGLDDQERQTNRERSRKNVRAYLSAFAVLPMLLAMDVKGWGIVIGFFSLMVVGALFSASFVRSGRPSVTVALAINFAAAVALTRVAGPFVLTPLVMCCMLVALTAIPALHQRAWLVMSWMVATVMVPILLEWAGLIPTTWSIGDGRMTVVSSVVHTHGRFDEVALVFGNLVFAVVVAWLLVVINRQRRLGQRQLFILAWHLRQLLPQADAASR